MTHTLVTPRRELLARLFLLVIGAPGISRLPAQVALIPLSTPSLPSPRDSSLATVFHIGDSTVRNGSGSGANGQ